MEAFSLFFFAQIVQKAHVQIVQLCAKKAMIYL